MTKLLDKESVEGELSRSKRPNLVRYNLNLPQELYDEIQAVAEARQTTVIEVLRQFIRLGLLAVKLEDKPNSAHILKEGNVERQILML